MKDTHYSISYSDTTTQECLFFRRQFSSSQTALFLSEILWILCPREMRGPLSQIRVSLVASLGAAQIIFLGGIGATENKVRNNKPGYCKFLQIFLSFLIWIWGNALSFRLNHDFARNIYIYSRRLSISKSWMIIHAIWRLGFTSLLTNGFT